MEFRRVLFRSLMAEAGLALAAPTPQVNKVNEGEPGQQAGLRKGDIVVAVGSLDKPSAGAMVAEIQKNAGKALAITVLRDKAPVTLTVTPTEHTQADGSVIGRSEEHTSELQSLMRISYAVFC